jgi:hypothetical protein
MNDTEADEPFEITTADMLEIVASGGNGSELVDLPSLLEKAAKELRTYETSPTEREAIRAAAMMEAARIADVIEGFQKIAQTDYDTAAERIPHYNHGETVARRIKELITALSTMPADYVVVKRDDLRYLNSDIMDDQFWTDGQCSWSRFLVEKYQGHVNRKVAAIAGDTTP